MTPPTKSDKKRLVASVLDRSVWLEFSLPFLFLFQCCRGVATGTASPSSAGTASPSTCRCSSALVALGLCLRVPPTSFFPVPRFFLGGMWKTRTADVVLPVSLCQFAAGFFENSCFVHDLVLEKKPYGFLGFSIEVFVEFLSFLDERPVRFFGRRVVEGFCDEALRLHRLPAHGVRGKRYFQWTEDQSNFFEDPAEFLGFPFEKFHLLLEEPVRVLGRKCS